MSYAKRLLIAAAALTLTACAAGERLSQVGRTPNMTPIDNSAATMGVPYSAGRAGLEQSRTLAELQALAAASSTARNANSLWRSGSTSFFGDPRANRVGDILTVSINIADRAQVNNQTARSRTNQNDSNLSAFFGGEAALDEFLNDAVDPANLASFGSTSSLQGAGSVNRSETIELTAAAIVVEVLWNGNMIVHGRQEVRINNEIRELLISGIVRPEDIAPDNTIAHTKIAEARISYGGRGHISDMQRPPIGQEIYDILWPF